MRRSVPVSSGGSGSLADCFRPSRYSQFCSAVCGWLKIVPWLSAVNGVEIRSALVLCWNPVGVNTMATTYNILAELQITTSFQTMGPSPLVKDMKWNRTYVCACLVRKTKRYRSFDVSFMVHLHAACAPCPWSGFLHIIWLPEVVQRNLEHLHYLCIKMQVRGFNESGDSSSVS